MKYWTDFLQNSYVGSGRIYEYVNLIEIFPVVIEIGGVENSELVVPVNNILVCHMALLATEHMTMCLDYIRQFPTVYMVMHSFICENKIQLDIVIHM